MERWRTYGAFLLSLTLAAGPVAGAPGKGDGKRGDGERGRGRATVEQGQRAGKAQRQARAQRAERRDDRAERRAERAEQRSGAREAKPSPQARRARQELRSERVEQRRDRVEQRRERVEPRRQRVADRREPAQQRRERAEPFRDRVEDRRERRGDVRQQRVRRDPVRAVPVQPGHTASGPMRFRGLDRDGDGRVTQREWNGNDVSFRNHDWNRDGVLAGPEVVPGARRGVARDRLVWRDGLPDRRVDLPVVRQRPLARTRLAPRYVETVTRVERLPRLAVLSPVDASWAFDEDRYERRLRVEGFAPVRLVVRRVDLAPIDRALLVERFHFLDADRDRYVSAREWSGPQPLFHQLDTNRDDLLVVSDFDDARYVDTVRDVDRERYVAFHLLDVDDDGMVAPWEWTGDLDAFFLVDVDDDGVVSLAEYLGLVQVRQVPLRTALGGGLDLDGDGDVTAVEWWGDPLRFVRLDLDRDGELEPLEAVVGWLFQAA